MAKKKIESASPTVTNLPLPISDTPLVIDLPDGQKIVIGKMNAGSVIEVATWRGTGRPDSRTNRLMMGMNSGSAAPQEAGNTETPAQQSKQVPQDWKSKTIFIANALLASAKEKIAQLISILKNRKTRATTISSAQASASSIASSSEVDEWLEKVLARSEKRAALATQRLATPMQKAAPKKVAQAQKPVKKAVKTKKKSTPAKRKK